MTLLIVILCIALIILLASWYTYRRIFCVDKSRCSDPYKLGAFKNFEDRRDEMREMIRLALSIPYEDIYVQSFDGYRLRAKYYEISPDAPLQIMFHGYRGEANKDFSGGLRLALDGGFNVILVDERAHAKSEGRCLSFGVLERKDVLSWVNYAVERFGADKKIILVGISMGAATVLMASDLDFPGKVLGIVADCPYSSPKKIIIKVMKDMHYPSVILYPLARLGALIFGHFDPEESSAEESVKHTKLPILLIHGQEDDFVPHSMSCDIFENCASEKYFESFPVASHGMSFMADYPRYKNAVYKFENMLLNR